jgi:hypothetical protein
MANNKKTKKRQGEFMTLKEARAEARNRAGDWYVDIYQEPDGTFSIRKPTNGKAVFVVAIDKSGARYIEKWKNVVWSNQKKLCYVKIEK